MSDPIGALAGLMDAVLDLKQLPRTGWLLSGIRQPESIADHTYGTAVLTMVLGDRINADAASAGKDPPLDMDRAVRLALLHDLAESLLTDLPKRSADLLGVATKHQAESQAATRLFAPLSGGDAYLALWHEYDAATTPEARLVKDADKLEMVQQALRYTRHGHAGLGEFWQGHIWYYDQSRALFAALVDVVRYVEGSHAAG